MTNTLYKNCVKLSLLTIIVLKLISNSYGGRGVIDADIMYVHRACFFVNISFTVTVIFRIVNILQNISYFDNHLKNIARSFCHFFDAYSTRDQGFFRFKFSKVGGAQNTRVRALLETLRYYKQYYYHSHSKTGSFSAIFRISSILLLRFICVMVYVNLLHHSLN